MVSNEFADESPPESKLRSLRAAVIWTVLSLLAFFVTDAAVFRSGWYLRYLEPNSTAGLVELNVYWITHSAPRPAEILLVGDSRIAEGFSSRGAQAAVPKGRFWNLAIPGSSPRIWYYMIRDIDPTRRRFEAIVLPLDHYADEDSAEDQNGRYSDLNYVIGRMRLTDCAPFARSVSVPEIRFQIFVGCFLKAVTLRRDILDFLATFRHRIKFARDYREHGLGYIDGYEGKPEAVDGISVDWATRRLTFPATLNAIQRSSIEGTVTPEPAPQTGSLRRYRQIWLGGILDLYKNSGTKIIFIETPRAPLPIPESPVPAGFMDSVRSRPDVLVLPAGAFRDLETPRLFADGLHLNHFGRPLFSQRLATEVAALLGWR